MSEDYNGLKNTAKSRYREKLQTVGLTIEGDQHTSLRITKTISLTTCLYGPKSSTGTYLLTLLSACLHATAALVMERTFPSGLHIHGLFTFCRAFWLGLT